MENLIFVDESECCVYSTQPIEVYWYYYDFNPHEWKSEQVIKDANVPEKSIVVSEEVLLEKIRDDIRKKIRVYRKYQGNKWERLTQNNRGEYKASKTLASEKFRRVKNT